MDLKKEYKNLVERIKMRQKGSGSPSRNSDIAKSLGYTRTYFSELLGARGKVTADHLKDLKLHFPFLSDNTTKDTKREDPDNGDSIKILVESNRLLVEGQNKLIENNTILARIIQGMTEKLPTESELPGISKEQLPIFHELQNLIATAGARGWNTEDEALVEIGTRLHDVMEKPYAKGKQPVQGS